MAGYDSSKAKAFNALIQNGASIEAAYAGAGITADDQGNYAINNDPQSRNFGRLGIADENAVAATDPVSPPTAASYGTNYTQPAQSFGAINLSTAQDPYAFPGVVGGPVALGPNQQQLNTYPTTDVPVTTNTLTGVQFDVGGFPIAQTTPEQSPFNTAPGAGFSTYASLAPDTTVNNVSTTATFPYIQGGQGQLGFDVTPIPDPVNPQVDPLVPPGLAAATTGGGFVTQPDTVTDTTGYFTTDQTNANILGTITSPQNVDLGLGAGVTQSLPVSGGEGTNPGTSVGLTRARDSNVVREQRRNVNNKDWRVRLRLAPRSNYLYNDPSIDDSAILFPLKVTDGVIFPYTPSIQTSYNANYSQYDLTHSNYKGYFYQNSSVAPIQISGTFTAQSTDEADYLLAVIHFFRSASKMFYGQDADAGAPPPLMFLSGFGNYQFNEHPVLLQTFTYNLPNNVDYIRCNSFNQVNLNLLQRRNKQSLPSNPFSSALARLQTIIGKPPIGANPGQASQQRITGELGGSKPTYVPTSMEISITLLPTQTRQQVSKEFSVKGFANGDLLQGGFW